MAMLKLYSSAVWGANSWLIKRRSLARLIVVRLNLDQRKILSEFLANLGVAWFAGGIIAPILALKKVSEIYIPGVWGLVLALVSLTFSLSVIKNKRL